jgi:hypothetical protein
LRFFIARAATKNQEEILKIRPKMTAAGLAPTGLSQVNGRDQPKRIVSANLQSAAGAHPSGQKRRK